MKKITIYVHTDKESSWQAGKKAGLKGEALEMAKYLGYEHAMKYEVDETTGEANLISVDGRKLEKETVENWKKKSD
jgi:hypothetical protein